MTVAVALLALAANNRASAVVLSSGAASGDITPDPKLTNCFSPLPYGSVRDPLYAHALVLSDGKTKVVFLSWDLVDARDFAVARVRKAIFDATGIPEAHILVQATHTHSGPKSEMGPEPLSAFERKFALPAQRDPLYRGWADHVIATSVAAVRKADAASVPVVLSIGRANVGEVLFNRRPVRPDGTVQTMMVPVDPYALPNGLRFGMLDPTMTVLDVRTPTGGAIATVFHVPAHAVSIYGGFKGLSADWPGAVVDRFKQSTGAEALFLQGCAGDIVPWRRGPEAVEIMSRLLWERGTAAAKVAAKLEPSPLRVSRSMLGLPPTADEQKGSGRITIHAEVQVITMGSLALVALPGEPLNEMSTTIQQRSPFANTIVLGYSNGRGISYVGLPGNKIKGGYEMTFTGAGADEAGLFLIESAVRLLLEHAKAAAAP